MSARTTIISAPGKVLLAGGYLVLDPEYTGAVVATSSRFYTIVKDDQAAGSSQPKRIRVASPQFDEAVWEYEIEEGRSRIRQTRSNGRNKFVELALGETMALARALKRSRAESDDLGAASLDITIVGDNDFYSQRQSVRGGKRSATFRYPAPPAKLRPIPQLAKRELPPNLAPLTQLTPFNRLHTTLSAVHKTGLGSSAALITSLVAALLVHWGIVPRSTLAEVTPEQADNPDIKRDLALVHNTAQYVHCLAQGKVGSGFDVSSAVYGGQVYRRFEPRVLEKIMAEDGNQPDHGEQVGGADLCTTS